MNEESVKERLESLKKVLSDVKERAELLEKELEAAEIDKQKLQGAIEDCQFWSKQVAESNSKNKKKNKKD